jgi:hypothetical protein
MSVIQAGNTTTTSLIYTGDTTGNLVFTTGGANTVALTLANTQAATFAGAVTITGTSTHTGNASFANIIASGTLTTASQGISYSSMPAGSVLQVVNATYNTTVTTTATTLITTGLTASITPKFSTSKILVLIVNPMRRGATSPQGYGMEVRIYRNGSSIFKAMGNLGYTDPTTNFSQSWLVPITYLDSPATTSSTTYAMYFASAFNGNQAVSCVDSDTATITLIEIVA